jgi:hypothetical protein
MPSSRWRYVKEAEREDTKLKRMHISETAMK